MDDYIVSTVFPDRDLWDIEIFRNILPHVVNSDVIVVYCNVNDVDTVIAIKEPQWHVIHLQEQRGHIIIFSRDVITHDYAYYITIPRDGIIMDVARCIIYGIMEINMNHNSRYIYTYNVKCLTFKLKQVIDGIEMYDMGTNFDAWLGDAVACRNIGHATSEHTSCNIVIKHSNCSKVHTGWYLLRDEEICGFGMHDYVFETYRNRIVSVMKAEYIAHLREKINTLIAFGNFHRDIARVIAALLFATVPRPQIK